MIIGPIASGKSLVSQLVTSLLVEAGLTVACLDVDDVAAMLHAPHGLTEQHWNEAHRAHGSLVGAWLPLPIDVVIAHGPIYTQDQTEALMKQVPGSTSVLRVLLLTSIKSALQRVKHDPCRELSKDPSFLRWTYEQFWTVHPKIAPCDLVFDSERQGADTISVVIRDRLLQEQAT